MDYITISRFSIPVMWLAFFGAVFYLDYRLKTEHKPTVNRIDRFVWQYLLVWKLSYIVFSFEQFKESPTSILYFDGGIAGHVLALLSIGFVIWKKQKEMQIPVLLTAWFHFVSMYHIIYFALTGHWLLLGIWVLVALASLKWRVQWLLIMQWFLIGWVSGLDSYFVFGFVFIILLDAWWTKKTQLLAFAVIAGLISTMLSEFELKRQAVVQEEIKLQTTTGETYQISEQDESYVIVNFFATWCLPCNAEMPHLQRFASNLPDDTQLIGVNLTARDHGEEALEDFLNKYGVTYPILLDVDDVFGKGYGVLSIPTTVVLKDGIEIQRFVGPVSEQQLRKIVEK